MNELVHLPVLVLLYSTHITLAAHHAAGQIEYAILFDAGSSKTRMEIYQVSAEGPSLQPSDVTELNPSPDKVKPGIADLAEDPSKVEAYMMPLLESAKKTIRQDKHAATPIFLLATAGMRLLPEDQQNAILDEVRKLFKDKTKCPFMFEDDNDARIISGKDEGIYAWVSVNFLSGVFGSKKASFGSLDLGGASQQNIFALNRKKSNLTVIKVSGRTYKVFAHSYLGHGQDEAREKYLRSIVQNADCVRNSGCILKSPCHNKGFKGTLKFNDQLKVFEGTAQVDLCRQMIHGLLFCRSRDLKKCPFSGQPRLRGKIYGISAIYFVLSDIGTVCTDCENNEVTPRKIGYSAEEFCRRDYNEININPYSKNRCFGANYIYELLTTGYKLAKNKRIAVAGSLHGFDLGWTLGAMLLNTGILGE